MADPLTILGAAAAASQLLQQGFQITSFICQLYSKVQDAPESIRKQVMQIEQLIDLARLIIQNPSLQTASVASILSTCMRSAAEVQGILKKVSTTTKDGQLKKVRKALTAVMKEKEILALFNNLEREKGLLTLCIQEIDAKLLHTIKIEVEGLSTAVGDVSLVVHDTARDMTTVVNTLPEVSANLTDLRNMLPSVASNVTTIMQLTLNQRIPPITPVLETNAKSYYMVPNRRVRAFVGREDILAKIETGFSISSAPRIVVLRGLGGQGKTQVALEYCRRAKSTQVQGIFWIEASSENTLRKSFESIAERLKGPDDILQDADARVAFALEKLGAWPYAWLMVFDNYDDPVSFNNVQDFMPRGEQGAILVTSRHAEADSLADEGNAIELPGLDERDALELLFKQSMIKETDTRLDEGKLIVKRLGYHPLAIAQAGSYMKQQKIELHQFMDHYNRRREVILQQTPQMSQYRRTLNGAERETTLSVFTTWELSFQQLQAGETLSNRKADFLTLFAFFDCRDISENLFEIYCNSGLPHRDAELPGGSLSSFLTSEGRWNSDLFVEVLIDLTQMSLVQAWSREDADGFCHLSLHPLIKDWIRLRTNKKASQKYSLLAAEILGNLIRSCWRYGHFEIPFVATQAVLSHLDAFEENTKLLETDSAPPPSGPSNTLLYYLESWFAMFLSVCGREKEAEEMCRHTLESQKKVLGPEHPETLGSLGNLALALQNQGKYMAAEEMHRRTLKIREKALGPEHPDTLRDLNNLALALYFQGKYKAAEEMFRRTLESKEKVHGLEHPDTLTSLNNLALALHNQGKYKAAEEMHRHVLEVREKVFGLEHPETLRSLGNLALAVQDQGKYEAAEEMFQRTLKSQEKALGPEHPDTLKCLGYLALALQRQGKYEAAEEMFRRVLESQEKVLGSEHPDTLNSLNNLTLALQRQGKYEAAEEMFRRVLESQEKVLGPEHLDTLNSLNNLALALQHQGKYEAAEEMHRHTLEIREKVLGLEHPVTLRSLGNLALALQYQGKYEAAEEMFRRALESQGKVLGPEHPDTLKSRQNLTDVLQELGRGQ